MMTFHTQTRDQFVSHTNPMAFLHLSTLKQCNRDLSPLKYEMRPPKLGCDLIGASWTELWQVTTRKKRTYLRERINSITVGLVNYSSNQGNPVDKEGNPNSWRKRPRNNSPQKNQISVCIPYKYNGFLEHDMSCLGLLKETITLFEWNLCCIVWLCGSTWSEL